MNEDKSELPASPEVTVGDLGEMNAAGLFWPVSGDSTAILRGFARGGVKVKFLPIPDLEWGVA